MAFGNQLSFNIENMPKLPNQYSFVLTMKNENDNEVYKSNSSHENGDKINFSPTYKIESLEFQRRHDVEFELYKKRGNDIRSLAKFKTNLVQLLRNHKGTIQNNIVPIKLNITVEKYNKEKKDEIKLDVSIEYMKSSDYYFIIERKLENELTMIDKQRICTNNSKFHLQKSYLQSEICGGNISNSIQFRILKKDKEKLSISKSIKDIIKNPIDQTIQNKRKSIFNRSSKDKKIRIYANHIEDIALDAYISSGLIIECSIGIDFTLSNKNPESPESLHYSSESGQSLYEKALYKLIPVLNQYDDDKLYPVYGFGAFPNKSKPTEVSPCFPLWTNNICNDINGVIEAYKNALNNVELAGPTHLAPLIMKMNSEIIEKIKTKKNIYFMLIILTDGDIDDDDAVRNALNHCMELPLSIVIIGIGDNNLKGFKLLREIDENLVINKKPAPRDIVHFVEFQKFDMIESNDSKFQESVLTEIPQQIREYMSLSDTTLEKLQLYCRRTN